MDDDFAFDIWHVTREEYDAHEREQQEWNRKFEAERNERERLALEKPLSGYCHPADVWRRSFVSAECESGPLPLRIFAVGSHLAEVTVELREAGEAGLAENLLRDFGNLRDVLQGDDASRSEALAQPVLDRFIDSLAEAAAVGELRAVRAVASAASPLPGAPRRALDARWGWFRRRNPVLNDDSDGTSAPCTCSANSRRTPPRAGLLP